MNIYYTTQFKKDYKRIKKQHKDLLKFEKVLDLLTSEKKLPLKYRDHNLSGQWIRHRECHIEPDWILIYRITSDSLYFERMGSHSDLFV